MSTSTRVREDSGVSDYEILFESREMLSRIKRLENHRISTRISRVGDWFRISSDLGIEVAGSRIASRISTRWGRDAYERSYLGAIDHEEAHAVMAPWISRFSVIAGIVYSYASSRGLPYDPDLLARVDNIASDIANDLELFSAGGIHRAIAAARLYLCYRDREKEIADNLSPEAERDPGAALMARHIHRLSSIEMGREPVDNGMLSDEIYRGLERGARERNGYRGIADHISAGGSISHLLSSEKDIAFRLADTIASAMARQAVELRSGGWGVEDMISRLGFPGRYLSLLLSLYAFYSMTRSAPKNIDPISSHEQRPIVPLEDAASAASSGIGAVYGGATQLLQPDLAERIAMRLLRESLSIPGIKSYNSSSSEKAKIPYLVIQAPPDPSSLVKEPEEWSARIRIPGVYVQSTPQSSPPNTVTILIDDSGSTADETSILERYGVTSTVFDVERVTAMAMLRNIIDNGGADAETNIVLFSTTTRLYRLSAREAYEALKTLKLSLEFGGTDIRPAIEKLIDIHRDSSKSYVIIMSDMNITREEARMIWLASTRKYTRSKFLVLSINNPLPESVEALNNYRNSAAVSVKTAEDMIYVEAAIRKLAHLGTRRS
ncbi:MAG: VWA domain-containing protein [Sulfolobales archaeon]